MLPLRMSIPGLAVASAVMFGVCAGHAGDRDQAVREQIKARCEELVEAGTLVIRGAEIAAVAAVPGYYRKRDYEPVWTKPENIEDLVGAAQGMYRDGFDPDDYHCSRLLQINDDIEKAGQPGPELLADRELLLTDSVFRIAYHAEFGKVDPEWLDENWNIHEGFRSGQIMKALEEAMESGGLGEYLEGSKPQHELYQCLKSTLEKYRGIQAAGGWKPVPDVEVLKRGVTHENVIALRERLAVTGDLPEGADRASAEFDEELEKAVMYFQGRHGLAQDGVVGKASFEALNTTVEERIGQLRVNLERARWVLQDFSDTFILVNIAGFRIYYVVDNRIEWSARVQVGTTFRQTPVFRAETKYLVFNPTWTVPPTILAEDVLPAVQKDVGYLKAKNMVVLDNGGNVIDPLSINWSKYRGDDFPYAIRQDPGPDNALGRIKFILPNKHFVFLHDTPSKALFKRAERAFSSGCIRVEHPLELAEILLADKGYDQARISQVLDTRTPENVYLTRPVPTLLLYWTAFATLDGRCNFRKDVYGRDPGIVAALDGPIMVHKVHEAERERNMSELRENR